MLYSMTGFGRVQRNLETQTITIELKSINSKTFDLRVRLPQHYQPKEMELRRLLNNALIRGKVDFSMHVSNNTEVEHRIDAQAFEAYYHQLLELASKLGATTGDIFQTVSRLPGVVVQNEDNVSDEEWQNIESLMQEAIDQLNEFRRQEGELLCNDMRQRIQVIVDLLLQVPPFEEERMIKVRQRLMSNLEQFQLSGSLDNNRFEQELLYYLDKLDITEEKIRLQQHCDYFLEVVAEADTSLDKGKKLNFIIQEIGREINTLGSKANFAEIQKIVVQMKDEADKIKEQLANIL